MADRKHLILVIDDDDDVRDTLRLVLEKHGYEMADAASAEDGLRQYDARTPDLIIVDLMMEEVDSGTSIVKELRLRGNEAPVFMLSSVGDALYGNVAYTDLGLAGVFQKPIDVATLVTTLEARLG
ncbi:MAG: response regulator transcription factor [Anaerolineae bacterium]